MDRKTPNVATEQRNRRTRGLDDKSTLHLLRTIHREDETVAKAVASSLPAIARAVDAIVQVLRRGGRLFYVGAGSSGRLAALDAAELPPTFGTPAHMVQAVIAGGRRALTHAVADAEDNRVQGARDLAAIGLTRKDVVVGITASGSTPYVLGALEFARRWRLMTVAITSNPRTPVTRIVNISIVAPTGPEVITGSTRMKAGTAQKMVLNMLSTASMIRTGRVHDNWMVSVALTNRKLHARGLQILMEASGATLAQAKRALRQSRHTMDVAFLMLKAGVNIREAKHCLQESNGNIREALATQKQTSRGRLTPHG